MLGNKTNLILTRLTTTTIIDWVVSLIRLHLYSQMNYLKKQARLLSSVITKSHCSLSFLLPKQLNHRQSLTRITKCGAPALLHQFALYHGSLVLDPAFLVSLALAAIIIVFS